MASSLPASGGIPNAPTAAIPWLSRAERAMAAGAGGGALAILLLAATLTPSDSGLGTHQQLGLPPCTWPFAFGMPCPACGMTTAFAHAVRGDLLSSFLAQPFGALLALATAMVAVTGLFAACTGTRVFSILAPLASRRIFFVGVVALLAAWGYKIIQYKDLLDIAAPGAG